MSKKNTIFIVKAIIRNDNGDIKELIQLIKMPKEADEINACSAFTDYHNKYHSDTEVLSREAFRIIDGTEYYNSSRNW